MTESAATRHSASMRLVVLWSRPTDEAAFEAEYLSAHMPLATKLAGMIALSSSRTKSKRFLRIAELYFPDADGLERAMKSEAGRALSADAQRLEQKYGVQTLSIIVTAPDASVTLAAEEEEQ